MDKLPEVVVFGPGMLAIVEALVAAMPGEVLWNGLATIQDGEIVTIVGRQLAAIDAPKMEQMVNTPPVYQAADVAVYRFLGDVVAVQRLCGRMEALATPEENAFWLAEIEAALSNR